MEGFYRPDGVWRYGVPPLPALVDLAVPLHVQLVSAYAVACGWRLAHLALWGPLTFRRELRALLVDQDVRHTQRAYTDAVWDAIMRLLARCAHDGRKGIERDQYGYAHWPEQRAWIAELGRQHGCAFLDCAPLVRGVRTRYWRCVDQTLCSLEAEVPVFRQRAQHEHLVVQMGATEMAGIGLYAASGQYSPSAMAPHGRPQVTLVRPLHSAGHELAHFMDDCLAPNIPNQPWYGTDVRGSPVRRLARQLKQTAAHQELLQSVGRLRGPLFVVAQMRSYMDDDAEVVARFTAAVLRARAGQQPSRHFGHEQWSPKNLEQYWPPLRSAFAAALALPSID